MSEIARTILVQLGGMKFIAMTDLSLIHIFPGSNQRKRVGNGRFRKNVCLRYGPGN